jgi:hypothetical protein
VVSHTGEAELNRYDNFYFFTPKTRLVMFGPKRPDKLMYYRRTPRRPWTSAARR